MNRSAVINDGDLMSKTATSVTAIADNTWAQAKQQSSSQHPFSGDWSDGESLVLTASEWSATSALIPWIESC